MPILKTSGFAVEIPAGARDESTYAFALRSSGDFRPSIVIQTEVLDKHFDLRGYVQNQLSGIQTALTDVSIVETQFLADATFPTYVSVFDSGTPTARLRQTQWFILLPDPHQVVTLTGTNLREDFDTVSPLFEAVFRTLRSPADG